MLHQYSSSQLVSSIQAHILELIYTQSTMEHCTEIKQPLVLYSKKPTFTKGTLRHQMNLLQKTKQHKNETGIAMTFITKGTSQNCNKLFALHKLQVELLLTTNWFCIQSHSCTSPVLGCWIYIKPLHLIQLHSKPSKGLSNIFVQYSFCRQI